MLLSATETFDKYADITLDMVFSVFPFVTGPVGLGVSVTYVIADFYFDDNLIREIRRKSYKLLGGFIE